MTLYIVGMFFVGQPKTTYMWCIRDAVDAPSACNDAKSSYEGEAGRPHGRIPGPQAVWLRHRLAAGHQLDRGLHCKHGQVFSACPESGRPVYKNGSLTVEGIK